MSDKDELDKLKKENEKLRSKLNLIAWLEPGNVLVEHNGERQTINCGKCKQRIRIAEDALDKKEV